MKRIVYLVLGILILAPALVKAQTYPYSNDTVRISGGPLQVGLSKPLHVWLFNQDPVVSFTLGFICRSVDGGFAIFDSLVWRNRLEDPQILDYRKELHWQHNGVSPDTVFTGAVRLGANGLYLPPGSDVIMDLYFTGLNEGFMEIDSGYIPPAGPFFLAGGGGSSNSHTPQFVSKPIEIYLGYLPPVVVSDINFLRAVAGESIEAQFRGDSPEGFPIEYELVSVKGLDDSSLSPTLTPYLETTDVANLKWATTLQDVGIWSVYVEVCDSVGLCDTATMRIEIVSSQQFLVQMELHETPDFLDATSLSHGNFDDDIYPEIIAIGGRSENPSTLKMYDYNEGEGYTNSLDIQDENPKMGMQVGFVNEDDFLDFVTNEIRGLSESFKWIWGVSVYLGQGAGPPLLQSEYATSRSAEASALADFTGDGWLDFATVNVSHPVSSVFDSVIELYEGNTLSQFSYGSGFAVSAGPQSMNNGDFNNDGLQDLAIGTDDGLSIYLNNGKGDFYEFANYPQKYSVRTIQVTNQGSDFNGDNNFDLCISTPSTLNGESLISVFLGNGNGEFVHNVIRTVKGLVFGNTVADFNLDGNVDIAYVNASKSYVGILFGNGDGAFPNEIRFDIPKYAPRKIDCLDMDVDGDIDIIVGSFSSNIGYSLFVFENGINPNGYKRSQMDILGSDNARIELTSKSGQVLNSISSTIPSGEYYLRNADGNAEIDDFACVSVVESGEYSLVVSGKSNLSLGYPFSLQYTLGGKKYRLAKDAPMESSGYTFKISPDGNNAALPINGAFSFYNPPTFLWSGAGPFDFELATDIKFDSVIHSAQIGETIYELPLVLSSTDTAIYYWRVKPTSASEYESIYALNIVPGASGSCGDIDGGGSVDIGDAIFLLNYIFRNGVTPVPIERGDTNGSGEVNVGDAISLIKYFFKGGLPPICL